MRLPLSKVYRAFPELDRFSDRQCTAYVRTAVRAAGLWSRTKLVVGRAVTVALIFTSVMVSALWMIRNVGRMSSFSPSDAQVALLFIGLIVVAVLPAGVVGYVIRDAWLRRAVRRQLNSAARPGCNYLLLGLPVLDGKVRCPECGEVHVLANLGLTPDDLLAQAECESA